MKRGQFQAERAAFWGKFLADGVVSVGLDTLVLRDVTAAEAAGVTWDPEEKPMAERLMAVDLRCRNISPAWGVAVDNQGTAYHGGLREVEARAAAEAYNRRPTFERIAQEMTALHDRCLSGEASLGRVAMHLNDWIDHLRSPIQ